MAAGWHGTRAPTEKHDDGVALCGDEAEGEDIFAAAVVALWDGLAEGGLCVEDDLLVLCADEMVDDVRG